MVDSLMRNREKIYPFVFKTIDDYVLSQKYSANDYMELYGDLEHRFPLESEYGVYQLSSRCAYRSPSGGFVAMGDRCYYDSMKGLYYDDESKQGKESPLDALLKLLDGFQCMIYPVPLDNVYKTIYVYTVFLSDEEQVRRYYYKIENIGLLIFQVLSLYYRHFRTYNSHYLKYFAWSKRPSVYRQMDSLPKKIHYRTPSEERRLMACKSKAFTPPPVIQPGKILDDCFKRFAKMTKKLLSAGIHGGMRESIPEKDRLYINLTKSGDKSGK